MRDPSPSLAELAEQAMREATAGVIAERAKAGETVCLWREGAIVEVPAAQVLNEVREAKS